MKPDMKIWLRSWKNTRPTFPASQSLQEPIPDSDITEDREYVKTLLGGDYLSVARARGAQHRRRTAEMEKYRLDGMLPVAEDWHAKVCLLEVSK